MRNAALLIATSTARSRGAIGSLDFGDGDVEPVWLSPKPSGQWRVEERAATGPFAAPADAIDRSLTYLGTLRSSLPVGSFVFVLSDFLADAGLATWLEAIGHRWDIVPVVIQDPVWEASFPEIGGVVVTFVDAASGAVRRVRMRRGEARRLRAAHEARHDALVRGFIDLGLEPVVADELRPRGDSGGVPLLGRCPAARPAGGPVKRLRARSWRRSRPPSRRRPEPPTLPAPATPSRSGPP